MYHLKEIGDGRFYRFGALDPIVRYGSFGVDIFFVLSGFIMTHVYLDTFSTRVGVASYGTFLQNRLARLYPLHIATLAVMVGLYAASRDLYGFVPERAEAYSPASISANLTMTHAWFAGVWAPNTPAWSVSAEWFAYLVFPLTLLLLARSGIWVQAAMIALALVVVAFSTPMEPLVRISTEFAIGMGTYLLYKRLNLAARLQRGVGRYAGAVALCVIVASLYAFAHPMFWIVALFAAVLITSLASGADLLAPALRASWVVYLGEISYSIYMSQWFVWSVWRRGFPRLLHRHIPDLALMGSACLAILAISVLAYHYVEVPGRRWIRNAMLRGARGEAGANA